MSEIKQRRVWEDLASTDPMWAVLTDKKNWDLETFFATGEKEINFLLKDAAFLGYKFGKNDSALDFGCGLGRLTIALSKIFGEAVGVDISNTMVQKAREFSKLNKNCKFEVISGSDLKNFKHDSFNFIYTRIVLQHMQNKKSIFKIIQEFKRVAKPNALIVFQLPSHIKLRHMFQIRRRSYSILKKLGFTPNFLLKRLRLNPMRMQYIKKEKMESFISSIGLKILKIHEEVTLAPHGISATYFVSKN